MTKPSCDRHKNLQMVPFSFAYSTGTISGHVCPVPGCGRVHDEEGYFDVIEGKILRAESTKERGTSVTEKILKVIRARAGM
ncbi:MAG TPA: hypothetical protein VEV41_11285 [Terriglobales bacterium]|jgi:hypothetical protein|nr:hypothetical protein [Terriglobales bacterium]